MSLDHHVGGDKEIHAAGQHFHNCTDQGGWRLEKFKDLLAAMSATDTDAIPF